MWRMATPYSLQVVIDSAQPHVLADWWAEALGWRVEEQDEQFIRSMIAQGFARESDTASHRGSLVWRSGAAINPPGGEGPSAGAPRILFQEVPEPKSVKNRVHLDLRSTVAASNAELERLLTLGARGVGAGSQGPHHWVVLADPEGNEFCLPVPAPAPH